MHINFGTQRIKLITLSSLLPQCAATATELLVNKLTTNRVEHKELESLIFSVQGKRIANCANAP